MNLALLAVLLLAFVECGHEYRVRRDPSVTVTKDEQVVGAQQGIRYRVAASGFNSCCVVTVDVLNVGADRVNVIPYTADLTAHGCKVALEWVEYIEGNSVQNFEAMDRQVNERSHTVEKPLRLPVQDRNQQFTILPGSFLSLSYFAGRWRRECAPYSFKLRVDGNVNIASTFTEPTR
jgi:hypothetical protein